MKLSVIVCLYNTDKRLLRECLESIFHSTLDCEHEILLIDDGSTVDYGDVISDFRVEYRKIKNRGHLGARLYGISEARGDYVVFVDSDDTVSENYHRPMLEAAERQRADIVINGWAFHTRRARRVCIRDSTMSKRLYARADKNLLFYTEKGGREHSRFVLWNKLYRRSLLLKTKNSLEKLKITNIPFTYSEDALINFFNFKNAKKTVSVRSGFYFYRMHENQSITVKNEETLRKQIDCMSTSLSVMRKNIEDSENREKILKGIREWEKLMARAHYSHARAIKASALYPYIKERYSVSRNRPASFSDGAVYAGGELLGDNFKEIDSALSKIYLIGRPIKVNYERGAKCISRIISDMPRPAVYSKKGEITVPRREISFKNKIIHAPSIYKLGMLFFKKGTKLREYLKKRF